MKKTAKLFGAVALSAALACGTVAPAFAADTDAESVDRSLTGENKTADTFLNVKTEVDQLNVTVPLHATIVAKTGGSLVTPTNYQITNNSTTAIAVSAIDVKENDATNWKLSGTSVAGKDASVAGADFYLKLTPQIDKSTQIGTGTPQVTPGTPGSGSIVLTNGSVVIKDGSNNAILPSIPGTTTSTAGSDPVVVKSSMTFGWSGSEVSNLKATIKDDATALDVFTVSYTVGVEGSITATTHQGGDATHTPATPSA